MDCRECHDLLHDYYDKELDGAKYREVEGHLVKCRGCHSEWLEIGEVMGQYKSHVLSMAPSAGLMSMITNKLNGKNDKKVFAGLVGLSVITMMIFMLGAAFIVLPVLIPLVRLAFMLTVELLPVPMAFPFVESTGLVMMVM